MLTGMSTYFETATVTRKTDLLAFSRGNYNRLMNKKHASNTLEVLKEMMTNRLYLYIHRTEMNLHCGSLMKYLTLKLNDPDSLKLLLRAYRSKARRQTAADTQEREYFYGSYNSRRHDQHETNIISFLKMMGVYYLSDTSLPELETSTRVLSDLNKRLVDWLKRTKRTMPEYTEVVNVKNNVKRYRLEVIHTQGLMYIFLE